MNSLDDLLDQLGEAFGQFWSRIEESSAFNTIRENFETLPTSTQAIIKNGTLLVVVAVLFLIPISGILSSSSYISEYEEKKDIIQGLIEAEQIKKKGSPLPPGMTSQSMQSRIRSLTQSLRLVEGQGPVMSPTSAAGVVGKLAPESVKSEALRVNFSGLNLKQITTLGSRLEALDASVKMMGLKIQPSKKFDDYYDATFDLVSFSLPMPGSSGGAAQGGGAAAGEKKGNSRSRGRSGRSRPSTRSGSTRRGN